MDDELLQAMVQDMIDVVGHPQPPEGALQAKDWMKESGLSDGKAREALIKLVKSGAWAKKRVGNQTFYWKVMSDDV